MIKQRCCLTGLVVLILSAIGMVGFFSTEVQGQAVSQYTQQAPFPVAIPGGGTVDGRASATLANIDGNPDLEIIFGGVINPFNANDNQTRLYAYKADGSTVPGWEGGVKVTRGIASKPAVGDINNDGMPEIVVGVSGASPQETANPGGIQVFTYAGYPLWFFQPTTPIHHGTPMPGMEGVISSPALGDLDNNGKLDIVFGSWNHFVYGLEDNGTNTPTVKFEHHVTDTIWSSPAIADINGDNLADVIIGSDWDGSNARALHAFDHTIAHTGQELPGFPVIVESSISSSPAIGDINSDGRLDIVVSNSFLTNNPRVYAFDNTGNALPGWPVQTDSTTGCAGSPALADFDSNGTLEVVLGCENGEAYAWHHDGQPVYGWAGGLAVVPGNTDTIRGSPAIVDYDGDGQLEILFAHWNQVVVLATNGIPEALNTFNTYTPTGLDNTPAVADIDQDGTLEMVVPAFSIQSGQAQINVWELAASSSAAAPWPMFRANVQNTGVVPGYTPPTPEPPTPEPPTPETPTPETPTPETPTPGTSPISGAIGDFDGDGKSDILWHNNQTGENTIWFMNKFQRLSEQRIDPLIGAAWRIGTTGDFNGDGTADIVWRNTTTGENNIWFMDGTTRLFEQQTQPIFQYSWVMAGTGDFDNDGNADILWRDILSGWNTLWLMTGAAYKDWNFIPTNEDLNWMIKGTGDFDGDGQTDILWRNTNGSNTIWFMSGFTYLGSGEAHTIPDGTWDIVGTGDFNGDGRADVLWRNELSQESTMWIMDGNILLEWQFVEYFSGGASVQTQTPAAAPIPEPSSDTLIPDPNAAQPDPSVGPPPDTSQRDTYRVFLPLTIR